MSPPSPVCSNPRDTPCFLCIAELGVTCVKGDNKDTALIIELASKADIVLNAADADDATLAGAILQGCKLKFDSTSVRSVYIHTSGLAVLGDRSEGVFDQASPIYDASSPVKFQPPAANTWST